MKCLLNEICNTISISLNVEYKRKRYDIFHTQWCDQIQK